MKANIERTDKKRIVIVGGGLGGLELAFKLVDDDYQVVLIDKNNYHQFPPLIYQVASGGLEPSSISFPFRRLFQGKKDFFFRMAKVESVNTDKKTIKTTVGEIDYDYLVLAFGAKTNFFGNKDIEATTLPMKSVSEAMRLRNTILRNLELALTEEDPARKQALMNIVVVGGGASGVEIAGAVAEMKKNIIARDYPDLDSSQMHIYLVNAGDRLLSAMDPVSSKRAERDLKELHVHIRQPQFATEYKDGILKTSAGLEIPTQTVIWVSGICANTVEGFPAESIGHAGRFLTDRFCRVKGVKDVYAIGDVSLVEGDEEYPLGHPQLAQVAMQQAKTVAKNFKAMSKGKELKPFKYKNLGVMATIGRNHAVAEISGKKFGGFPAWALWLVVHLRSILGLKNKTFILLNWVWNYINYKQSLRLILKAK
ncbi:NAD(P)/FAD-dependent oxidoreductase [Prevotella melaninogenica]|uniref:NAD(P)/FAD-dependent oxidoreductase n=1 Tax=Prevotella melaninogenica TaxID=28132 RepID=UPI001BA49EBC|nr:NAD(P)/FAD-dependent oxidoreductase [Prevotella melaninogenica]QUB61358.1 NAD(P)/FAD-dependent oxidoreductase [Prevotella melaninogenica]